MKQKHEGNYVAIIGRDVKTTFFIRPDIVENYICKDFFESFKDQLKNTVPFPTPNDHPTHRFSSPNSRCILTVIEANERERWAFFHLSRSGSNIIGYRTSKLLGIMNESDLYNYPRYFL